jgi:DNA-binding CsgD family transcriptional regulator
VDHCRELIGQLATARVGVAEYAHAVLPAIRRMIGFDGWCLGLTDPVSRLPAAAEVDNAPLGDRLPQFWQFEFEPSLPAGRITAGRPAAVLAAAARRDPPGTRRFAELLSPGGVGDELRIPLIADRLHWGSLSLFRSQEGRAFTETDIAAATGFKLALAAGARGTWAANAPRPGDATAMEPGTVLLTSEGSVISRTPQAQHWLARLGSSYSMLTAVVAMLGTRMTTSLRTRTTDGLWLRVSGGRLVPTAGAAAIAITLQPASPAEITPLLLRAYGLTPRQRVVARFILTGYTSQQVATMLHLSLHTVNDHVEAIKAKTGVRSRFQLPTLLSGQPPAATGGDPGIS